MNTVHTAESARAAFRIRPYVWVAEDEAPRLGKLPGRWRGSTYKRVVNGIRSVLFVHRPRLQALKRWMDGRDVSLEAYDYLVLAGYA